MIHFTSLTDRAVNLPKHATPQIDPHLHAGTTSATASKYWEHEAHCYKARFDLALDALAACVESLKDAKCDLSEVGECWECTATATCADASAVLKACGR